MRPKSTKGKFIMKIAITSFLSLVFGFSAAALKDDKKPTPEIFLQQEASNPSSKFLKMQPKNCNINGTTFEEAIKECLQKERGWLHL
jgi:hypothetical protein